MSVSSFHNPVRLRMGERSFELLGEEAAGLGRRALIVTGRESMRRAGYLDRAVALLEERGLSAAVYEGALPNPTDGSCEEAGARARAEGCDLVIGLGGGSAMDTAKGAAVAATHDRPIAEFVVPGRDGRKERPTEKTLPLICVTSTAGTSSQLTPFAVITATADKVKAAMAGEAIYPRVSICDPELTYSAPPRVTAATGVDVLCHSMEAYYSCGASPVTDMCCERAIALVGRYLPRAVADGGDREARRAMSDADIFAGFSLSNCGGTIVHAIEHPLSAHYPDLPHGEGLAALLPAYVALFHAEAPERFGRVAELLGAPVEGLSAERAAERLEPRIRELLEQVGLSVTLTDLGVAESQLREVAADALGYNRGTLDRMPLRIDESHILAMLERSL